MRAAGDDLQVGDQGAVVQGGGDLADAAAQLLDGHTGAVGVGGLVAVFCGALAQGGVVVEGLTGLQHHAVDGSAGQGQVDVAVLVVGVVGLIGGQHITEQHAGQLLAQNLGDNIAHLDLDGVAVDGFLHQQQGLFQIEAVAVGLGGDLKGLQIHGCIDGFCEVFLMEGFQVDDVGDLLFSGHFADHQEFVVAVGIQDHVVQVLNVHITAGVTQLDDELLTFSFGIEGVQGHIQLGHFTLDGDGGGSVDAVEAGTVFLQTGPDQIQVQVQVGQQGDGVLTGEGLSTDLLLLGTGAGAAVAVSGFHHGVHIQLCAGFGGGELHGAVGQFDDHILGSIGQVGGTVDGYGSLLLGHAAQIHAGDGDIADDQAVIGTAQDEVPDTHNAGGHQGQGSDAQGDQSRSAAFFLLLFGGVIGFVICIICTGLREFAQVNQLLIR